MLGMRDGIISYAIKIEPDEYKSGCYNMTQIDSEMMSKYYLSVVKKRYTPIGIARCNNYIIDHRFYWKFAWHKGEVILTFNGGNIYSQVIQKDVRTRTPRTKKEKLEVV